MDRNTLIGFILIAIVFIGYMIYVSTTTKPPVRNQQMKQDTALVKSNEKNIADSIALKNKLDSLKNTPLNDSINSITKYGDFLATFTKGNEEFISIESDLYRIELSSKGATILEYNLKEYKQWEGYPTQLIWNTGGELFLTFDSKDKRRIDTRNLFFTFENKERNIKLGKNDSVIITARLGNQNSSIIKKFVFYGNQYAFGGKISLVNMDDYIPKNYRVVWEDGLRFQENNSVDEAKDAEAIVSLNGNIEENNASGKEEIHASHTGTVDFAGVKTKYFGAAIIPSPYRSFDGTVDVSGYKSDIANGGMEKRYTLQLIIPYKGGTQTNSFQFYVGPLQYDILKEYQLTNMINFGWRWLIRPIGEYFMLPFFKMIHSFVPNFGISILIFALFIKLLLYPLSITQVRSSQKMQLIGPEMAAVREKYKDDNKVQQQEIMKLYSEYGINPAGGCLPLIFQMPILYAMWSVLQTSIELRQANFFLWIKDLSIPDVILTLPFRIPILNINKFSGLALLMGVTMFVQQKMTISDPRQKQMVYLMPVMFTLMFSNFPAGLNLYYFMFNLLSIAQQYYMNHFSSKRVTLADLRNMPKKEGWLQKKMKEAQDIAKSQGRSIPGVNYEEQATTKSKYTRKKQLPKGKK